MSGAGIHHIEEKGNSYLSWGIKEDFWDIAEENRKFIYEDDTAHAILCYENGEPQYSFVTKGGWDHYDEIGAIMSNPALTQEQKALEVKKILG